ncbi:MAG: hypothetical protein R3313_03360 [Candidatus Saccharimonadales bacterium]|nr:hypothetical protein [Candidatus Saccharimonadales bacterium]
MTAIEIEPTWPERPDAATPHVWGGLSDVITMAPHILTQEEYLNSFYRLRAMLCDAIYRVSPDHEEQVFNTAYLPNRSGYINKKATVIVIERFIGDEVLGDGFIIYPLSKSRRRGAKNSEWTPVSQGNEIVFLDKGRVHGEGFKSSASEKDLFGISSRIGFLLSLNLVFSDPNTAHTYRN